MALEASFSKLNSTAGAGSPPLEVEAVMFDLDGTLIDSTEVYYRIVEVALERLGMSVQLEG